MKIAVPIPLPGGPRARTWIIEEQIFVRLLRLAYRRGEQPIDKLQVAKLLELTYPPALHTLNQERPANKKDTALHSRLSLLLCTSMVLRLNTFILDINYFFRLIIISSCKCLENICDIK
jgi:hypothetical protein